MTTVDPAVRFAVQPAAAYSGDGYDLVTMFDRLHDIGDPAAGSTRLRRVARTPLHLVPEARP